MDTKTISSAKKIDVRSARRLIFVMALSSTLGFWVVASKASQISAALTKETPQAAGGEPPTQLENQFVLELPPLPTLVPALESPTTALNSSPVIAQSNVTAVKPSLTITGKILMGGAKPSTSGSVTITTTGSSK
jgi:hypothetical protein